MTPPTKAMLELAERCELYAKVIEGITVVPDDWQDGEDHREQKEPKETLLECAAFLRSSQNGELEGRIRSHEQLHARIVVALGRHEWAGDIAGAVEEEVSRANDNGKTCVEFAKALRQIRDGKQDAVTIAENVLKMPWLLQNSSQNGAWESGFADGVRHGLDTSASQNVERERIIEDALHRIARHPQSKQPTKEDQSSYGVGWAFWNVQEIAKEAIRALKSGDNP